jgi:TetR/AcrR family transcriptional regulator, cholesterol catabolism regulator
MVKKKQKPSGDSVLTRKEEIIRVAARLFAIKGYHATTLDEIAGELGVTKPALYYHIQGKEDILREIVNRIMEPMEAASRAGRSNMSPRERIKAMVAILVKFGAERKETTLIAFEEVKILPKRTRDAIRRRQKEVEQSLQETLQEGIAKGEFTVEDTKLASFAILGAANWIYHWYRPHGLTPEEIAERFIDFLENGYQKRSRP